MNSFLRPPVVAVVVFLVFVLGGSCTRIQPTNSCAKKAGIVDRCRRSQNIAFLAGEGGGWGPKAKENRGIVSPESLQNMQVFYRFGDGLSLSVSRVSPYRPGKSWYRVVRIVAKYVSFL